jgi:predicted tellurium resistance membrane protein TerC
MEILIDPGFWASLFSVTLVQIALGADNLIIITIIANKLPPAKRPQAIRLGLILAMLFRIFLLAAVSYVLRYATSVLFSIDHKVFPGVHVQGAFSGKSLLLAGGGLILIWKGIRNCGTRRRVSRERCRGRTGLPRWFS